ncbi:YvrJ family protein [Anaerocellum danielii]|uniref:YvrJ family protein n=1 Tax=Anaerocellum danielii TaxID=1387557 RepID=A0ABZ0U130_9FIRM|nr:YvrJ family protein [Caldicellulosiruptor danielii]WPX08807.1 YvrJ family protein [Caldicellulosiruptor danielii]
MQDLIANIANIGFPIVLCIYLLTRFESKIDKLTESIDKLSEKILQMKNN